MNEISRPGRQELTLYPPSAGADQTGTTPNERGAITIPGQAAVEEESTNRPLTLSDFVEFLGRGTLAALRLMKNEKTGLAAVMIPPLIVAIRLAFALRGGEYAVTMAQTELWLIWLWCVLRIFF